MFDKIRPTWVEIKLDNLRENFRNIKKLLREDTRICGVVKANAYGHGSIDVARVLIEEGASYLAVATLEEGKELRNAQIVGVPILCLGYVPDESISCAISRDIDITVYSYEMAKLIQQKASSLGKTANIHIKLDTGMSRLGFEISDEAIEKIIDISKFENVNIAGVYTHFAVADEQDKTYTYEQYKKYMYIADALEQRGVEIPIKHVCNSAATIDLPELHMDMVRPGIILYGHYPSEDVKKELLPLKPVMTLRTRIAHIKEVEKDISVSYGRRYKTVDSARIATLPIGYADGFTRMLDGNADVMVNGRKVPVVGRICMDQCMVEIGEIDAKIGDEVTIFSDDVNLPIERFADKLGTINYELLCMISRRIPRVYTEQGEKKRKVDYLLM